MTQYTNTLPASKTKIEGMNLNAVWLRANVLNRMYHNASERRFGAYIQMLRQA